MDRRAPELLALGEEIGETQVLYLRQLGPFLIWRAGPGTTRSATRWMALDVGDLARRFTFRQDDGGSGHGEGPSGRAHDRFRTWKEDLRADGRAGDGRRGRLTPRPPALARRP